MHFYASSPQRRQSEGRHQVRAVGRASQAHIWTRFVIPERGDYLRGIGEPTELPTL
jgi:hypothetical protein